MNTLIQAKKSLSQNFLVNPGMQKKVIIQMKEIFDLQPLLPIVEVGPGQGDLTQFIVDFGQKVVALEIDYRAVELLDKKFEGRSNLEVIENDALEEIAQPNKLLNYPQFNFLSNLPFNVGSRILVDLPIYYPSTNLAVIVQLEVAQKINPKLTKPTFFGTWISLFWETKIKFHIKPNNFLPVPKVDCAMFVGVSRNLQLESWLDSPEKRLLARDILKSLFHSPRKSMVNNLKTAGWGSEQVSKIYEEYKLDINTRIEWNNYRELLKILTEQKIKIL